MELDGDIEFMEKGKESGKLYQDELYGTKVLTPLAVSVIDTPEFQRLASLKQLGFSDLVYRGAVHTRFSHAVGTYLLTRTIMRRIVQNHERLGLKHPGQGLPECFRLYPHNSFPEDDKDGSHIKTSYQSLWRGLTEVVSIAALVHDIGHVPFGHTLEDEFVGIYDKHDRLGGPRLYEMLFNENSHLCAVFGDRVQVWLPGAEGRPGVPNTEFAKLIYVVLSWKEEIDPPASFETVLKNKLDSLTKTGGAANVTKKRLEDLQSWHSDFRNRGMFHPFMSDIIGNTICADLLDYLPRDRMNLGMEWRQHGRLQRYLTIREGKLYPGEGLRISIMVTRHGRGGQRRDVATAVLDIMRERYEMAERVYYHHKKAAASAMLAKLAELCPSAKPEDSEDLYPAPWTLGGSPGRPRNMVHFSDSSFIDHLGAARVVDEKDSDLQHRLYVGLRYDRSAMYRTLMVIDTDLVHLSSRPISYFAMDLREYDGKPSNRGRQQLEHELALAGSVTPGEVLVYCPSPDMQSKEVDARLEIIEGRVLPLRVQTESFAYHTDVGVLEQYYTELWRMYIFVSPRLYDNAVACQAIVDKFCDRYGIDKMVAYSKVRRYDFKLTMDVIARNALEPLRAFLDKQHPDCAPFPEIHSKFTAALIGRAARDHRYLTCIRSGADPFARIAVLCDVVLLEEELDGLTGPVKKRVRNYIRRLESGELSSRLRAARGRMQTLAEYAADLVATALGGEGRSGEKQDVKG